MTKDKAKFKVSPKGKKKLLFQKKSKESVKLPLIGKTIFLDVKELKHQKKLQTDLKRLGATIEEFVSKDINYLITSQPRPKVRKDKKDNELVPSPFNCDPSPSPGNVEDSKASTVTRGKALAEKARINSRETTTMLDNAEKWGVKIVGLDAAYRWIDKANKDFKHQLKDMEKNEKAMQKQRYQNAKYKLLDKPFIKFESADYNYRPVIEDALSWPNFDVHTPRGSCPFDGTILKGDDRGELPAAQVDIPSENTPQEEKDGIDSNNTKTTIDSNMANLSIEKGTKKSETDGCGGWKVLTAGELRRRAEQKRKQRKKRGHCECCKTKYEDLDKHVREEQHRLYVREKSNYQHLDSLIGSVPSTAEFLRRWILVSVSQTKQPDSPERGENHTRQILSQPKSPRRTRRHNSGDDNPSGKENQPSLASPCTIRQRSNSVNQEKIGSKAKQPLMQDNNENKLVDTQRNENEDLSLRRSPRKLFDVAISSEKVLASRQSQRQVSSASPVKTFNKIRQSPRNLCSPVKAKNRKILGELSPKLTHESSSEKESDNENKVNFFDKTADFINCKNTDDEVSKADVVKSSSISQIESSQEVNCVTEELKSLLDFSKNRANKSGTSDDFEVSLIRSIDTIKLPVEAAVDNRIEASLRKKDKSYISLEDIEKENNVEIGEKVLETKKDKSICRQNLNDKKLQDIRSPRKQSRQEMNIENSSTYVENKKSERLNTGDNCTDHSFSNLNSDIPSDFQSLGPQGEILMFSKTLAERIKERGKRRGSVDNYNINLITQSAMSPRHSYTVSQAPSKLGNSKKISKMSHNLSPNKGICNNLKTSAVVASRRICQKYKNNRNLNQNKQKGRDILVKSNIDIENETKEGIEKKSIKASKEKSNKKFWYYEVETDHSSSREDKKVKSLPKIVQELHTSWNDCKEIPKHDMGRKLRRGTRTYYGEIDHLSQALALRKSNSFNVENHECKYAKREKMETGKKVKDKMATKKNVKVSNKVLDIPHKGSVSEGSEIQTDPQKYDVEDRCNQIKNNKMDKASENCEQIDTMNNKKCEEKLKPKQKGNRFWEYVIENHSEQEEEYESLHRELKMLKGTWKNLLDSKSLDSKRRSRSADISYRENSLDRECRKETRMASKSNTNELKNGINNRDADKLENSCLLKENMPEVLKDLDTEICSRDKNLEKRNDKETNNSDIKQRPKGRKFWDYVLEVEPEVTEIDENIPKEVRNLQSPWLNHKDIQTSDTKRRSRSIDVNYRETSVERRFKQQQDMSLQFDKEINDGKPGGKSLIKEVCGIDRLMNEKKDEQQFQNKNETKRSKSKVDNELTEKREKNRSRSTLPKQKDFDFECNINSDLDLPSKDEGILSKEYESKRPVTNDKVKEVKSGSSDVRKRKGEIKVCENIEINDTLDSLGLTDPQKYTEVTKVSQENKIFSKNVPIVSPKEVEISKNKKERKEHENGEGSVKGLKSLEGRSISSRPKDEKITLVDLQSSGKVRLKEKGEMKCQNTEVCNKVCIIDTRSTSPVFNKSPVRKVTCKKQISNKIAMENNASGQYVQTQETEMSLDLRSLRSPRKFKSPVKSPELMLVSSPQSGYSTSPRESRINRWKRKSQGSNLGSSPNSRGVKRRRLDKLKYVIEQEDTSVSSDKQEISPKKNVGITSEKGGINVSVDPDPCKGTTKDVDGSFSLKWQQVTLNSSLCEENKKVKLNRSWALISDRSASKLLSSEDDDQHSFNGFTEDDVENTHPSDLSYEEHSEVELLSSNHDWSMEEEKSVEKDEEFSKFVPTFSSPGKPSETDWESNVDSFMKNCVSERNQSCVSVTSPWRSPRRKSQNIISSPIKVTPVKKQRSKFLSRLNGSENGKDSDNQDREMVDEEIEFNHRSPQKLKCNFSPLRAENGVIVGHARKYVTSTPSQIKNGKSKEKNFSGLVFKFGDTANKDSESHKITSGQDYRILKKKSDTPKSFSLMFEASPEKKKKKCKITMQA